jgi:hypothetical protein
VAGSAVVRRVLASAHRQPAIEESRAAKKARRFDAGQPMRDPIEKIYDEPINAGLLNDRQIRERERELALAPQRAARRARDAAYAVAADAAERTGATLTDELRQLQHHVVDLGAEAEPPIELRWLRPNSQAERLVKPSGAIALHNQRSGLGPAIRDLESALVMTHEIAHHRAQPPGSTTLEREYRAWLWARANFLVWNQRTQDVMTHSLSTYLRSAKLEDVIWVQEIEKLCSHTEFCREKQRRLVKEFKL